jgi:hypothetical protein
VKRLDFEALLASSKDVFATEMKATFDGFRLELSTWKTSINDSMARNTTTLQAEIKAAIDTPAATSLKATIDGLMDTVPTFMQEMRATVSALSDSVKSLEDRVIWSQGQFTKTTLPSLRLRLDILEGHAPQVPQVLVEELPPAHLPESTVPPPPAALPVVLPSDPPDDSVTPTPRVPAERVHHPAPQSNLASPGLNMGNPGPNAPMAGTPDPLITSRAAYMALRACMSHEAAGETIGQTDGTRLSCGASHEPDEHSPTAPSTRATSGRHVTPHPSTPSQPSNRYRQPTIRESLFRGGVDIDGDGDGDLGRNDNRNSQTNFDFGCNGDHQTPMAMSPLWGSPSFPPATVTGPCMPARWVLVVLT